MSHACVLVAVPPCPRSAVEGAVSLAMSPFDEDGEWFAAGSRWDWWVIGGRYTQAFPSTVMPASDFPKTTAWDGEEQPAAAYAFLKEGVWSERGQLGWFGASTRTDAPGSKTREEVTHEGNTYAIETYNEEWPEWAGRFYDRFIEPLPKDWLLVVVDYHV